MNLLTILIEGSHAFIIVPICGAAKEFQTNKKFMMNSLTIVLIVMVNPLPRWWTWVISNFCRLKVQWKWEPVKKECTIYLSIHMIIKVKKELIASLGNKNRIVYLKRIILSDLEILMNLINLIWMNYRMEKYQKMNKMKVEINKE